MERKIQNEDEWARSAEENKANTEKATGTEGTRKKGVMKETGRLIHIQRQNSPKRL